MKCRDLMVGDWVADRHGYQAQITYVGIGYANFENDKVSPCRLDDKYYLPKPILLTPEILEKNGFGFVKSDDTKSVWNGQWVYEGLKLAICCLDREGNWPCFININDMNIKCEYVHQLQHALRLCGLDELADNFKV